MRALTLASLACLVSETSALRVQHKLDAEKTPHTGKSPATAADVNELGKADFEKADDAMLEAYNKPQGTDAENAERKDAILNKITSLTRLQNP